MNKKVIQGRIIIPKGAMVQPHELVVASILSWTGFEVEFLPVASIHTADIKFRGREWEIKSPKGKSSRTIENNMRLALKQFDNIVIDLSRIKMNEEKALKEVRRQAGLMRRVKKVIIITKSQKIIEI